MTGWARDASAVEMLAVALVLNVAVVATSAALWRIVVARRGVVDRVRPVGRRDLWLTASTTVANAVVLVPAWWAWREGVIDLAEPSLLGVIAATLYLVVGLDLTMYVLHRTFHVDPLYRWFHAMHHTDDERMCALTLFVMHPGEAAGFGTVTAVLMAIWPVPVASVGVFFTINLVVGTLAHVPPVAGDRAAGGLRGWLGGSDPHAAHHARPRTNYGFFTQVWDRLLRTA